MDKTLQVGKTYAVTSSAGCTVTDANGTVITTAESGQQAVFVAPTTTVSFSDDAASVVAVFNLAPAKLQALGLFGGGKSDLPTGYIPALFLESTGTQYIDTGIVPQCGDELKLENVTLEWGILFLSTNEGNDPKFTLIRSENLNFYKYFASGASPAFKAELLPEGSTVFCDSKGQVFVNNASVISHYGNGVTTLPLSIFGAGTRAKIGCCVLSRAGEKQCNYTPIITAAGVPAMWDSVTRTAKYNSGTGDFIVGLTAENALKLANLPVTTGGTLTISLPPDVVDENGVLQDMAIFTALSAAAAKGWSFILQTHDGTAVETAVPAGYMECEFLESTGSQYIDTGIKLSNESEVKCEFMPTDYTQAAYVYGSKTAWLIADVSAYASKGGYLIAMFGNQNLQQSYSGTKQRILANADIIRIDESEQVLSEQEPFETPYSAALFALKTRETFFEARCIGRIYNFTIANADTPQANYTPSIAPAGVPCMYDSVTAQPFTNAGSGAFVVGMTAAQAVQLANLPTGGGALTVSLPQSILNEGGEITDAAVNAALNKAADNGWTITLQYYTEQ